MFRLAHFPIIASFIFTLLSCTQVPDIPRLPSANRRPIEKIIIDENLGPTDVRKILHALNEDGSLSSMVKFFDELPDESMDGMTDALNGWIYDDGRLQKLLARRFDQREFSSLALWMENESKFAGAENRRALVYQLLSDDRAPGLIGRLAGFLDPRIIDGWRGAEKRVEEQFATLPVAKDKVLLARTAAEDIFSLLTGPELKDPTRETLALLLEKDAGDDIYRGLRVFAQETKGARGFEGMRQGLQRMMEKAPEKFQEKAERDNQLDLLLYLAEHTAADSRGFFTALNTGLETHAELIKKKKSSMQALVIDVYAERIRSDFSRPQFSPVYWKELLTVKTEGEAIRELYKHVVTAWTPVVGPADNSSSAGYRLAVHLNAFVAAKWLYFTLKNNQTSLDIFSPEAPFATQFWAMKLSPKPLKVNFAEMAAGELSFPQRDLMIDDLKPTHDLMENFARNKIEALDTFSYQLVLDKSETTLFDALFDALRRIDRRREIIGADTIARLAVQYVTRPELGGGFVISSFETDRLIDLLNRMVSVTSLDRFRSLNSLLFGDITLAADKRKSGLLNPDLMQVILEVFSESPAQQQLAQKLLWSAQAIAELDFHDSPDTVTPFQAYRAVVSASHFEENRPHWIGQALAYLSRIRAAGTIKKDDGSKQPIHPFFFDGLQSRSMSKKLFVLSQLGPADWAKVRRALAEFSDRAISEEDLKLVSESITPHREGFTSGAEWWEQSPLPAGWDKITVEEWEWLRDSIAHNDHSAIIRFFKGATREDWGRIAGELKTLHQNGTLARILQLLALIQDDRLRDFSRVLLKADASGELGKAIEIFILSAVGS